MKNGGVVVTQTAFKEVSVNGSTQPAHVLHAIDSRTGQYYAIPIVHNAINANDLKKVKAPKDPNHLADQNEHGLRVFDPGFSNTAVSESKITYIDGQEGTIQYRGYPLQDIIGKKKFIDVAHLLIWGKWPSTEEAQGFQERLNRVPLLDYRVFHVIHSFPKDGAIVGMQIAGLSCLQSLDMSAVPAHTAKALYIRNPKRVDEQIVRVLASLSMITAASYCHHVSIAFKPPRADLSLVENFLFMCGFVETDTGLPSSRHVNILERLWVLVADHEMTCSTAALLQTASSLPDVISCLISAFAAGTGPLHGGAIEVAYKHIGEIGSVDNIPARLAAVKSGKDRLYGYGHRVYRVTDPRFTFISEILGELAEEIEKDPLLKVALALDKAAAEDEYFISRKLRPNADLFAAFVYKALGFPPEFILAISAVSRSQGFLAHWKEAMEGSPRIWRPSQLYTGDLFKKMDE
ncbi:citrate synthase-like protein [Pseudomassariella vexata]|uniref:Citrate synthase n=1 Tax=Pseudomassariella vexata TaxID=1141098 RepID=A0A1Y2D7S1_9PEZI|nr:citrate synthase-like protein [Pseudomassariella vexata]ORY55257.1 citrate synthase-like protein [Pseudomassariella vexata]